jgi:predicted DNA-binding protein
MKKKRKDQLSIRLPPELLERFDKLTSRLAADALRGSFGVTRAAVLRLALTRGIEALEAEVKSAKR